MKKSNTKSKSNEKSEEKDSQSKNTTKSKNSKNSKNLGYFLQKQNRENGCFPTEYSYSNPFSF